jgi:hypothetical protein
MHCVRATYRETSPAGGFRLAFDRMLIRIAVFPSAARKGVHLSSEYFGVGAVEFMLRRPPLKAHIRSTFFSKLSTYSDFFCLTLIQHSFLHFGFEVLAGEKYFTLLKSLRLPLTGPPWIMGRIPTQYAFVSPLGLHWAVQGQAHKTRQFTLGTNET